MNGRPMNALEYYAQLAQQQQIPPGNPIAEYLLQREAEHMAEAEANDAAGGAKQGLGLATMLSGAALSPFSPAVGFPVIAGGAATKLWGALDRYNAANNRIDAQDAAHGANMWEQQFGPADTNRGYPGTQSGPGKVQPVPDWLTGRAMKQLYEY